MTKVKSKVLSFVLLFAMLITILPVNTFADTNAISVVAKSNMADVKISGDTVNIDITKSVKDLAKMFSKVGKEVKVTLSYFDGEPKEITKTYSDATKFSVKLDTTCKMYYTVEFKPSYYANKETHYGYEYVNLEVKGKDASPSAPEISTGSTTTSVDTNTNTDNSNSNVNGNVSGSMDLNDGFFTLAGPTENVSVDGNKPYTISVNVPKNARDVYFVAYTQTPTNMNVNVSGFKSGEKTFTDKNWVKATDDIYMLLSYVNINYQTGNLTANFTPETSGNYRFMIMYGDRTTKPDSSDVGCYPLNTDDINNSVINVQVPKIAKVGNITAKDFVVTFSNYATLDGLDYKVCKAGSDKSVVKKQTTMAADTIHLNASCVYTIQVRGYRFVDNKKVYSKWSAKKYIVAVPVVKKEQTKKTIKANSVNVQWNKVKGATNYIVAFSKDGKHFKKLCETKKTNYKYNKKIATKQYFRITAVKKVAGKTVKSTPYDLMVYRYYKN